MVQVVPALETARVLAVSMCRAVLALAPKRIWAAVEACTSHCDRFARLPRKQLRSRFVWEQGLGGDIQTLVVDVCIASGVLGSIAAPDQQGEWVVGLGCVGGMGLTQMTKLNKMKLTSERTCLLHSKAVEYSSRRRDFFQSTS